MLVQQSIVINKPKTQVFDYLKYALNQNEFSVLNMKDPGKKTSVSGTDGTIGFTYNWDSKDKSVGAGSQEIIGINPDESITYKLTFERPMKNEAKSKSATVTCSTPGELWIRSKTAPCPIRPAPRTRIFIVVSCQLSVVS